jgi:hypothetical protein
LLKFLSGLIGTHINAMRPKVMLTLESVIRFPELQSVACTVWYTFVKSLEVASLGPMLNRIFVDLLPLVKDPSVGSIVVNIFKYLVIKNRDALKIYFKEIPLNVYEIPAMKEIVHVIQKETVLNFKDEIGQLIR